MRITFILFCFLLFSCNEKDCDKLPSSFGSYNEAIRTIRNSYFKFEDRVSTSKSSWIRGAEYYSCNYQTGFFIIETDKKYYIHQDMPIEIWNGFKEASSFGQYYNVKIKHRYQFHLDQNIK